jgi:hypothetical protein
LARSAKWARWGTVCFFFWVETPSAKVLYVTAIAKKKDLANRARLNDFITAAEARRTQFLEEESQY